MESVYTGYKTLELSETELNQLYQGDFKSEGFKENEYLIVVHNNEVVDYYQYSKGSFNSLKFPMIGNDFTGIMKPRNAQQYCAIDLLKNNNIPLKLITGKFGTGKSMMCIVAALEALQKNKFEKIVFVRNNVQVKDTDPLGALPGDIYNKTLPYVAPFADHCGGEEGLLRLIENHQLEVIPLGFLRGRSIKNSIIYSMETENLTKEHLQLLMGRVDENSQLWLDGDIKQRDKKVFETSQGIEKMVERLSGNSFFGYVHLIKSERSKIAALADELD